MTTINLYYDSGTERPSDKLGNKPRNKKHRASRRWSSDSGYDGCIRIRELVVDVINGLMDDGGDDAPHDCITDIALRALGRISVDITQPGRTDDEIISGTNLKRPDFDYIKTRSGEKIGYDELADRFASAMFAELDLLRCRGDIEDPFGVDDLDVTTSGGGSGPLDEDLEAAQVDQVHSDVLRGATEVYDGVIRLPFTTSYEAMAQAIRFYTQAVGGAR